MKKLKENIAIFSALLAVLLSGGGALTGAVLYAESTYYKAAEAQQQFRDLRLDGLYRDQATCEDIKQRRKLTPEETKICARVEKQIKALEKELGK